MSVPAADVCASAWAVVEEDVGVSGACWAISADVSAPVVLAEVSAAVVGSEVWYEVDVWATPVSEVVSDSEAADVS